MTEAAGRFESESRRSKISLATAILFLVAMQGAGFLWFGITTAGWLYSGAAQLAVNLLAIACAAGAFRRSSKYASFWLLFSSVLVLWAATNALFLYYSYTGTARNSGFAFDFLYRSYGVPILLALFVSDSYEGRQERILDIVQVGIAMAALYVVAFSVVSTAMVSDAGIPVTGAAFSNAENAFLIALVSLRLAILESGAARSLLRRLLLFLLVYGTVAAVGNYLDTHAGESWRAWFDLFWTLPYGVAALVAFTWSPSPIVVTSDPGHSWRLGAILTRNLLWAVLVVFVAILASHFATKWHTVGTVAVAVSILLYAARLSITQYGESKTLGALKKKGKEFRDLAHRQTMILESAAEGILGLDNEGRHVFVNRSAARMLGYEVDELIGRRSHDTWHHTREDGSPFPSEECPIYATLRDDAVHYGENEVVWRKDGSSFYVEYTSAPSVTPDGQVSGAVVVLRDITERRLADKAVLEAQDRSRALFAGVTDALIVYAVSDEGWPIQFLEVNDVACQYSGYTRDELLGMTPLAFAKPGSKLDVADLVKRLNDGQIVMFEETISNRSQLDMTVDVSARKFDFQGQPSVVAVVRDVTERKRSEEALHRAESNLLLAAEVAGVGAWEWDIVSDTHIWSEQCKALFGIRDSVPRGYTHFLSTVHPEDHDAVVTAVDRVLDGTRDYNVEYRVLWPDGSCHWVTSLGRLIRDAQGRPARLVGIVMDICARKQAEEKLKLQGAALEAAANAIVITDPSGKIEWVNSAFTLGTGYSPEEVIGLNPRLLQSGRQVPSFYADLWSTIASGRVWHGELENKRKDGSFYIEEMTITPVRSRAGDIDHFIAIKQDITSRKREEEALRKAEEALRLAVEGARLGTWEFDVESDQHIWSDQVRELLGLEPSSPASMEALLHAVHPADRTMVAQAIKQCIEIGTDLDIEHRVVWPDGSIHWSVVRGHRYRGPEDKNTSLRGIAINVTELKDKEQLLTSTAEKYRDIISNSSIGVFRGTPGGRLLVANKELAVIMGYDTPEEAVAECCDLENKYVDQSARTEAKRALEESGILRNFEFEAYHSSGSKIWLLMNARLVTGENGDVTCYEGTIQDITEKRTLETQFRQAQKLEGIGRLAGGVAHDFNNILGVIMGYADILETQLLPEHPARKGVLEIQNAGRRAANLTRQLLVFSRKQVLQPHVLNLNALIDDFNKMLPRMLGEDVELTFTPSKDLRRIKADPGQLEQLIMNLAVNARDAMPHGGRLLIQTANVDVDSTFARKHSPMETGMYVYLSVTDTGCGMSSDALAHLFEPFFTTKESGKGTGLGLSIVYGVVKQTGGYIWVDSELNRGTTFNIYLPVTPEPLSVIRPQSSRKHRGSGESILVVEDEAPLRDIIKTILVTAGYKVTEASNGTDALSQIKADSGDLKLLLSDIIMPGNMSGWQLAEAARALNPNLIAVFMTGFTAELEAVQRLLNAKVTLIMKPFTSESLLMAVREALKGPATERGKHVD